MASTVQEGDKGTRSRSFLLFDIGAIYAMLYIESPLLLDHDPINIHRTIICQNLDLDPTPIITLHYTSIVL